MKDLSALPSGGQPKVAKRDRRWLACEIARYHQDLHKVIQQGTPEERKRFIRDFVDSIELDGRQRKVRIAFYDDRTNSSLRVVPPTGLTSRDNENSSSNPNECEREIFSYLRS